MAAAAGAARAPVDPLSHNTLPLRSPASRNQQRKTANVVVRLCATYFQCSRACVLLCALPCPYSITDELETPARRRSTRGLTRRDSSRINRGLRPDTSFRCKLQVRLCNFCPACPLESARLRAKLHTMPAGGHDGSPPPPPIHSAEPPAPTV